LNVASWLGIEASYLKRTFEPDIWWAGVSMRVR
jgi:hypothetical protein